MIALRSEKELPSIKEKLLKEQDSVEKMSELSKGVNLPRNDNEPRKGKETEAP